VCILKQLTTSKLKKPLPQRTGVFKYYKFKSKVTALAALRLGNYYHILTRLSVAKYKESVGFTLNAL
jgi:hypothetical protein